MPELTLHHYALSPFSEKIRAMLGYTGMAWQSVTVREFPPRPQLDRLTGGYRKIPVAQIGADIFCDTRTISREIADIAGKPELALENCSQEVKDFVARADLEIFLACILSADGKTLLKKMRTQHSLLHVVRFLWDRINMGRKAGVKAAGPKQARQMVRQHLENLEAMLQQNFLFGDTPNIADFSAYHGLWFLRDPGESSLVARFPKVDAWMDRIKAFGHGNPSPITADEALDQAARTEPRPLPESGNDAPHHGSTASIAPTDYGRNPVSGKLVADVAHRWILLREDSRCGALHLHFPKEGFTNTAATPRP